MRKLMMLSVFMAAAAFFSVSAQEKPSAAEPAAQEIPVESGVSSGEKSNSIGKKLLMYIPNRLLDLLDIVSVELKSGAVIGAEARDTRAFGIGGEVGTYGSALKGYNRQYGFAVTEGAEGQFFFGSAMDLARPLVWGDIERYWIELPAALQPHLSGKSPRLLGAGTRRFLSSRREGLHSPRCDCGLLHRPHSDRRRR